MLNESALLAPEIAIENEEALRDEEPINAVTHGFGCLLALGGTVVMALTYSNATPLDYATSLIFAILLTVTYAASSLSHAVNQPASKRLMRAWDQGVIYLLIVGTYTPLLAKYVPLSVLIVTLALLWMSAFIGFLAKVVFLHKVDDDFSPVTYVALGWVPALTVCYYVPWECLQWVALGGVVYSIGVCFLRFDRQVPYFHTVWHSAVITASGLHFYAIYRFVLAPAL